MESGTFWHLATVRLVLAAATVLALACAGTPKPAPTSTTIPSATKYEVGASDHLTVRVLPEPAIERNVIVRPDGYFSMDLIGDVEASGKTTTQIAQEIQKRIEEYRQAPSVSVSLDLPASNAVAVLGEVKNPVLFPLERDTRVSEAVAQAGGPTELAAASRVRIIRKHGEETTLYLANLDKIQSGWADGDMLLERGDLVYVPPDHMVSAGYAMRRALYPLEQLFRTIAGPIIGVLIRGGL